MDAQLRSARKSVGKSWWFDGQPRRLRQPLQVVKSHRMLPYASLLPLPWGLFTPLHPGEACNRVGEAVKMPEFEVLDESYLSMKKAALGCCGNSGASHLFFWCPHLSGRISHGQNALVEDAWEDESGCQRAPRRLVKLVTCLPRIT